MASSAVYLPTFCRNVGEKTPSRLHLKEIEGTYRRTVWQAITWNGISPNADFYARQLPKEEEFLALNPLSRKYLAFTVNMISRWGRRSISRRILRRRYFSWNGTAYKTKRSIMKIISSAAPILWTACTRA